MWLLGIELFLQWLHWFAYILFAVPAVMVAHFTAVRDVWFLRYLSGIPFTEMQAVRSRGDDYRAYQRDTPMLFPWFPDRH